MGDPKIVITGTGRAGTTLLVRLLDELGLDTGLHEGKLTPYAANVRAGLECRVDDPGAPTVVKDMTLGFRIRAVLGGGDVRIAHVLIPSRRLDIAAASRVRAANYGRMPFRRGALVGTLRATNQAKVLADMREELLGALDDFQIPYTVIEFPRFALDAPYTHETLGAVLPHTALEDVAAALERCVRPEMIHEQPLTGRERWTARVTTVWNGAARFPLARFRRWRDPEASEARLRASVAAARRPAATDAEGDEPAAPPG